MPIIYSIRGKLNSMTYLFRLFGIMFSYVGGAFVDFQVVPYISLPVPILFVILFACLPNTPQQLLRSNQFEVCDICLVFHFPFSLETSPHNTSRHPFDLHRKQRTRSNTTNASKGRANKRWMLFATSLII